MAAKKLATMSHTNTHKTVIILAYTLLEWILILMLLLNSLFSYLIRKFASYHDLKPPCLLCSTFDHMLEPNTNINPYMNLVCEAHAAEISKLYCCKNDNGENLRCSYCNGGFRSMNFHVDSVNGVSIDDALTIKPSCRKDEILEVMDLDVVGNKIHYIQGFDQIIPLEWTDSSTSCSRRSSLYGDENLVVKNEDQDHQQGNHEDGKEDEAVTIDSLMEEIKSERLALCRVYTELDEERNASAIAVNQAMAMITRLQEEKAALQIESMQNQRMMEEQAEYDQEALQLLNELLTKQENEMFDLENELQMYKEKFLDSEGNEKVKMMARKCCGSSSITSESLDDTDVLDSQDTRALEESMVELEVERLWILDDLKEVEETLRENLEDASHSPCKQTALENLLNHVHAAGSKP